MFVRSFAVATMTKAKLKAQYNRVRTSVALRAHHMWTDIIGVDEENQTGSNAAIESRLQAPRHYEKGRQTRREAAKVWMEGTGYEPPVSNFEGLVALARAQGIHSSTRQDGCAHDARQEI